jgi:hypothetical protein
MSLVVRRALAAACVLCFATLNACGDSEGKKDRPGGGAGQTSGGAAGSGGAQAGGGAGGRALPPGFSEMPKTIPCGGDCTSATVGIGANRVYVDPCCTGANEDVCGINTAFLTPGGSGEEACEPRDQPGTLDPACPSPPGATIPGAMVTLDPMPGCCREDTGLCGVMVDRVTAAGGLLPLATLGLGCVDAESYFPGQARVPCGGAGTAGAGGASGGVGGGGVGGGGTAGTGGLGGASGGTGGAGVSGEAGEAGVGDAGESADAGAAGAP